SGLYDVTHGAGLAVMFPAYMRYALDVDVERFRRLAIRVWDVPDRPEDPRGVALAGIQAMEDFFRFIGMPVRFDEIGAREADIDLLTEKLFAGRKSATFGPFCPLTREGAKAVYRLACR
ncbi:MAG TPA: iron-containing alcohol dehydrogenase, partial [Bacillota bacterium]|nr:iron-containing alcohol dehydrogenase [Bacillota bacterium]